jgi:hypothetical protein
MRWERYAAVRGARFCVRDSTLRGAARHACASPRRIAVPAVGLLCGVDAGAREPCGGPYWERRFPTGSGVLPPEARDTQVLSDPPHAARWRWGRSSRADRISALPAGRGFLPCGRLTLTAGAASCYAAGLRTKPTPSANF